jgi:hypothetical protein
MTHRALAAVRRSICIIYYDDYDSTAISSASLGRREDVYGLPSSRLFIRRVSQVNVLYIQ